MKTRHHDRLAGHYCPKKQETCLADKRRRFIDLEGTEESMVDDEGEEEGWHDEKYTKKIPMLPR